MKGNEKRKKGEKLDKGLGEEELEDRDYPSDDLDDNEEPEGEGPQDDDGDWQS